MTRTCKRPGCDQELTGFRRHGRYCSSACRSAHWKARKGYKDPRSVRNAPQRRSGASQKRPATRYRVYQRGRHDNLLFRAELAAHDGPSAIRAAVKPGKQRYLAIPVRSLRDFDSRGR